MLLPELWPLKYQKWITFCIFCWLQLKISPTLDKILKCIWKVLFSSFRKYYELLGSGMLLARHQHWKIQEFGILLLTQQFVFDVSTHNISGKVKSKAYWPYHFFLFLFHYHFFARTHQSDLPGALKYLAQTVTNFLLLSGENMKNETFLTF